MHHNELLGENAIDVTKWDITRLESLDTMQCYRIARHLRWPSVTVAQLLKMTADDLLMNCIGWTTMVRLRGELSKYGLKVKGD